MESQSTPNLPRSINCSRQAPWRARVHPPYRGINCSRQAPWRARVHPTYRGVSTAHAKHHGEPEYTQPTEEHQLLTPSTMESQSTPTLPRESQSTPTLPRSINCSRQAPWRAREHPPYRGVSTAHAKHHGEPEYTQPTEEHQLLTPSTMESQSTSNLPRSINCSRQAPWRARVHPTYRGVSTAHAKHHGEPGYTHPTEEYQLLTPSTMESQGTPTLPRSINCSCQAPWRARVHPTYRGASTAHAKHHGEPEYIQPTEEHQLLTPSTMESQSTPTLPRSINYNHLPRSINCSCQAPWRARVHPTYRGASTAHAEHHGEPEYTQPTEEHQLLTPSTMESQSTPNLPRSVNCSHQAPWRARVHPPYQGRARVHPPYRGVSTAHAKHHGEPEYTQPTEEYQLLTPSTMESQSTPTLPKSINCSCQAPWRARVHPTYQGVSTAHAKHHGEPEYIQPTEEHQLLTPSTMESQSTPTLLRSINCSCQAPWRARVHPTYRGASTAHAKHHGEPEYTHPTKGEPEYTHPTEEYQLLTPSTMESQRTPTLPRSINCSRQAPWRARVHPTYRGASTAHAKHHGEPEYIQPTEEHQLLTPSTMESQSTPNLPRSINCSRQAPWRARVHPTYRGASTAHAKHHGEPEYTHPTEEHQLLTPSTMESQSTSNLPRSINCSRQAPWRARVHPPYRGASTAHAKHHGEPEYTHPTEEHQLLTPSTMESQSTPNLQRSINCSRQAPWRARVHPTYRGASTAHAKHHGEPEYTQPTEEHQLLTPSTMESQSTPNLPRSINCSRQAPWRARVHPPYRGASTAHAKHHGEPEYTQPTEEHQLLTPSTMESQSTPNLPRSINCSRQAPWRARVHPTYRGASTAHAKHHGEPEYTHPTEQNQLLTPSTMESQSIPNLPRSINCSRQAPWRARVHPTYRGASTAHAKHHGEPEYTHLTEEYQLLMPSTMESQSTPNLPRSINCSRQAPWRARVHPPYQGRARVHPPYRGVSTAHAKHHGEPENTHLTEEYQLLTPSTMESQSTPNLQRSINCSRQAPWRARVHPTYRGASTAHAKHHGEPEYTQPTEEHQLLTPSTMESQSTPNLPRSINCSRQAPWRARVHPPYRGASTAHAKHHGEPEYIQPTEEHQLLTPSTMESQSTPNLPRSINCSRQAPWRARVHPTYRGASTAHAKHHGEPEYTHPTEEHQLLTPSTMESQSTPTLPRSINCSRQAPWRARVHPTYRGASTAHAKHHGEPEYIQPTEEHQLLTPSTMESQSTPNLPRSINCSRQAPWRARVHPTYRGASTAHAKHHGEPEYTHPTEEHQLLTPSTMESQSTPNLPRSINCSRQAPWRARVHPTYRGASTAHAKHHGEPEYTQPTEEHQLLTPSTMESQSTPTLPSRINCSRQAPWRARVYPTYRGASTAHAKHHGEPEYIQPTEEHQLLTPSTMESQSTPTLPRSINCNLPRSINCSCQAPWRARVHPTYRGASTAHAEHHGEPEYTQPTEERQLLTPSTMESQSTPTLLRSINCSCQAPWRARVHPTYRGASTAHAKHHGEPEYTQPTEEYQLLTPSTMESQSTPTLPRSINCSRRAPWRARVHPTYRGASTAHAKHHGEPEYTHPTKGEPEYTQPTEECQLLTPSTMESQSTPNLPRSINCSRQAPWRARVHPTYRGVSTAHAKHHGEPEYTHPTEEHQLLTPSTMESQSTPNLQRSINCSRQSPWRARVHPPYRGASTAHAKHHGEPEYTQPTEERQLLTPSTMESQSTPTLPRSINCSRQAPWRARVHPTYRGVSTAHTKHHGEPEYTHPTKGEPEYTHPTEGRQQLIAWTEEKSACSFVSHVREFKNCISYLGACKVKSCAKHTGTGACSSGHKRPLIYRNIANPGG
ncbi:hypothetical protein NDU88_000427 [Pleurodeles waltl]|uniref:Uncharacterized protein n=1 Tax=Pleurodeles waltl TaxID=8319 RepID=A0AAV7Q328_PLEWA|nr:hypothetical protein NDU88_000427 [Pleurodeles waltl]